jgi:hypothetical protein
MLRYKRITTDTLTNGVETLKDILSGHKTKKYRVVSISTAPLAGMYLRVYKNSEQIVDVASIDLTTAAPILPMDIPIETGDVCKVGFFNNGAATTAKEITIGYRDE